MNEQITRQDLRERKRVEKERRRKEKDKLDRK